MRTTAGSRLHLGINVRKWPSSKGTHLGVPEIGSTSPFRVRAAGRCFHCLGADHKAYQCREPVRCIACIRNVPAGLDPAAIAKDGILLLENVPGRYGARGRYLARRPRRGPMIGLLS